VSGAHATSVLPDVLLQPEAPAIASELTARASAIDFDMTCKMVLRLTICK
jgi:hypothetical protein